MGTKIIKGVLYLNITWVECFKEGTWDLVGSIFDTCWKKMDLVFKFVGSFSNTSLNKSSWNNW